MEIDPELVLYFIYISINLSKARYGNKTDWRRFLYIVYFLYVYKIIIFSIKDIFNYKSFRNQHMKKYQ